MRDSDELCPIFVPTWATLQVFVFFATGMRLLDQFRVQAHLPLLSDQTSWLSSAEILGLGHAREESVELIPVGPTP